MDAMYWLMLASRVLHILGTIVLVGGIFYQRTVVAPAVPKGGTATADDWFAGRRTAWAKWVVIATFVLLVTGLFNYVRIVQTNERMGAAYQAIFGIKFLLALAVFALAAILAGRSPAADRLRQNMKAWLSVCLAVGILIVVLAGVLRSLPHVPTGSVTAPLLIQPSTGQPAG
jgi:putative copper export protein